MRNPLAWGIAGTVAGFGLAALALWWTGRGIDRAVSELLGGPPRR